MNNAVLVYPVQLFEKHPLLHKDCDVYLIEDARYFTDFLFHKQKLILHRASMKMYEDHLKKKNYHVTYIPFDEASTLFSTIAEKKYDEVSCFDPIDHQLTERIKKEAKKHSVPLTIVSDTPAFLSPVEWLDTVLGSKKRYIHGHFYQAQRKRMNILITKSGTPLGGKWTYDAENRQKLPETVNVPSIKKARINTFVKKAKAYVAEHFAENPGTDDRFVYPVTYSAAKTWLKRFLKERLQLFGDYQDAMHTDYPWMFHSLLSPLLNIGILTPEYVVAQTMESHKKKKVPLNSLEGFLRQVIGWREFIRGIYSVAYTKQVKGNFFNARKKIPESWWYGTTGLDPVDDAISHIVEYAYAHHIQRLMILGNGMLLSGFKPDAVYEWFMELFIDSYDWVMVPNVYGMSQYADGGLMTTKPYIAGSNYIKKMSNYKTGEWCDKWDDMFWSFVVKHKAKLKKIPRLSMLLKYADKKKKK